MSKLAVVTGGTRGIDKTITIALRDIGFTVVANFYSDYQAAKDFNENYSIKTKQWNTANYAECFRSIKKELENEFGRPVSVLMNNAGITRDAMMHKMTEGRVVRSD